MDSGEVIGSYHSLWRVEESFRMSKSDPAARAIFHRTREAIEAHLTVVFAALAVSWFIQARTGQLLKKIIKTLRPVRAAWIERNGQTIKALAQVPAEATWLVERITAVPGN